MSSCCGSAMPLRLGEMPEAALPAAGGQRGEAAVFAAGRSFVGTDRPQIAIDGEGPKRAIKLAAFALETETVTNARFAAFVAATGHVTQSERFGWSAVFRGLLPADATIAATPAGLPWWARIEGASWSAPEGPGSSIAGREDHSVVHVSWADARAFAAWVGGRLPSEAEWEHAARGGLDDPKFPWGDTEPTDAAPLCNIWQGEFPGRNDAVDGYVGTSPARAFAPNGAGLFGMAGNVWEWTGDAFRVRSVSREAGARNEQARREQAKVTKGGSFLCHASYCYRYRIAARSALPADSAASNVGFRVAYDGDHPAARRRISARSGSAIGMPCARFSRRLA